MTELEIQNALEALENDHIEFKPDLSATSSQEAKCHVMRTVTAFYNTKGGVIFFGVRDKTGELLGVSDPQKLEEGFFNQLRAKVPELDVSPSVEIVQFQGKTLVLVLCPRGPRPPYKIGGYDRPFVRLGSNNVEATDDQIAQMYRDRSAEPQDRFMVENATLDDLDLSSAEAYLKQTSFSELITEDPIVALSREGFISNSAAGKPTPTIAGLLLFGKNPQHFLPHAIIKADLKLKEDEDGWDDLQTFDGTILGQLSASEAFIKRHIPMSARIIGFRRVNTPLLPHEALREAIVNALVHRDYRDSSAEIHLRLRGSGVTVLNPGGVMPPLTVEIVMKGDFAPRSRNATIADALVRLGGYMEKRGSGIERMRKAMKDAQLPEPKFIEEAGAFRVVFYTPLIPPKQRPEPKLVISDDELKRLDLDSDHYKILELVEVQSEVRPNEACKYLGRSRPYSNKKLDELVEKRVLVRTTENKMDPTAAFRLHPRFLGADALQAGLVQQQLL